ncbi:MAG: DUF192 domain-containing protein [Chloroflexi bacterium]|nr:DUF192 domain-containing protein [Chloroflexota bacterium]
MVKWTMLTVFNSSRGVLIADQVRKAQQLWERTRGLLATPPLKDGEGLLIDPCNWIHTLGMGYAIDVLYIDGQQRVVGISERMKPNRIGPRVGGAQAVIELPSGKIAETSTKIGDQLAIEGFNT